MRHQKNKVTLDRKKSSRRALLASLVESLILYEKIETTRAKAKALRPVIEKLVTKAKLQTLSSRRDIKKFLYTESAVKKMMEVIGPRFKDRHGGYTRIINLGYRENDNADKAMIEFV